MADTLAGSRRGCQRRGNDGHGLVAPTPLIDSKAAFGADLVRPHLAHPFKDFDRGGPAGETVKEATDRMRRPAHRLRDLGSAGAVVTAEHDKQPGARGLSIEVDPEEALVTKAAPRSARKPFIAL
jgi:hypothetical protein